MDGHQFDHLLRSLATSRRTFASLVIAAGSVFASGDSIAAKKKKPCPPCKKRKKGKCKAKLPNGTLCSGGTCQDGVCAPPSCSDGVKNANETGVDCGGPDCPRCPNGQTCESRDDCRSAMCNLQINTCQECQSTADCGADSFTTCPCYTTVQGAKVCGRGGIPETVSSCTLCPSTRYCVQLGNELFCVLPCGS